MCKAGVDTTDQYGEEDDPLPVKQAAKADAMKDARYQRRRILKQRLTDLNDRGLVDNDAHNLLSWKQLVDVYLSEREQNERTKADVQGALDDRDYALKQVKERAQAVGPGRTWQKHSTRGTVFQEDCRSCGHSY